MPDNIALLFSLLSGSQADERTRALLKLFLEEFKDLKSRVIDVENTGIIIPPAALAISPAALLYELRSENIKLYWEAGENARWYEIRQGTDWDTAEFRLRTSNLLAFIDPLSVGEYTFLLRAINVDGVYSEDIPITNKPVPPIPGIASVIITIPQMDVPTLTAQVISNYVYLRWTEPSSPFRIVKYNIYKDEVLIGTKSGTFTSIQEIAGGSFVYSVGAVNIIDEEGPRGAVSTIVHSPPDFDLQEEVESDLSGTKVNCILNEAGDKLIVLEQPTQTFQEHFDSQSWASPQAQIDAGYPYFLQESPTSGSYQEEIDFGAIVNNVIVNTRWNEQAIDGSVTTAVQMEVKDNLSDPYSSPSNGPSQFFQSVRYLRITLNFTGGDDTALMLLWGLNISLDVRREIDSGYVTADASDTDGTEVTFNKSFIDIESIKCQAENEDEPVEVDTIFVDDPYPTSFKVKAWDSTGNRITVLCYWQARGIV